MNELFEKLQKFLVEKINEKLSEVKDDDKIELTKDVIYFGSVDLDKIVSKIAVVVIPASQEDIDDNIGDFCESSEFEITFIFKKDKYDILLKRMCMYASTLRQIILENPSMNGEAENISIGLRKFFVDCGVSERTVTAFETNLKIETFTIL